VRQEKRASEKSPGGKAKRKLFGLKDGYLVSAVKKRKRKKTQGASTSLSTKKDSSAPWKRGELRKSPRLPDRSGESSIRKNLERGKKKSAL